MAAIGAIVATVTKVVVDITDADVVAVAYVVGLSVADVAVVVVANYIPSSLNSLSAIIYPPFQNLFFNSLLIHQNRTILIFLAFSDPYEEVPSCSEGATTFCQFATLPPKAFDHEWVS